MDVPISNSIQQHPPSTNIWIFYIWLCPHKSPLPQNSQHPYTHSSHYPSKPPHLTNTSCLDFRRTSQIGNEHCVYSHCPLNKAGPQSHQPTPKTDDDPSDQKRFDYNKNVFDNNWSNDLDLLHSMSLVDQPSIGQKISKQSTLNALKEHWQYIVANVGNKKSMDSTQMVITGSPTGPSAITTNPLPQLILP